VVAVTYGITIKSVQDEYIIMTERTMDLIGKATVPGANLYDLIQIIKYLPAWLPFRREAAEGRLMIEELVSKPFYQTREDISRGFASHSLVSEVLVSEELTPRREAVVKWAAGSLYGAGAETERTYATVLTFIMVMALHPEKQKLVHAEMDRVLGTGRMPHIQDRNDLPYLDAVIKETARWHPILSLSALGIARQTNTGDWYKGFYIPKGTIIVLNVWAVAFSQNDRYNPQDLIPETFLDNDFPEIDPASWSFGFGRRVRPGKAFAENLVFILIASLVWSFTFSVNDSEVFVPQFTENLVSYPKLFKCTITPRSDHHTKMVQDAAMEGRP
ncbi:cytochrome P450, partial [Crepidotus variabilis]